MVCFRSCGGRDQVGLVKVCDTSWLTPRPVNPLNIGQESKFICLYWVAKIFRFALDRGFATVKDFHVDV